jgi:DNA-binding response OmpR family regulator
MNLLIVEDETRVADFIARGLSAEGYVPSVARSGTQGLEMARRDAYAVIVLDVMLPGLTGLELCQELRAAGNRTPILMLSALDAIEDKIAGLRLGADDYMTKPFSFDELVARVAALIRRGSGQPVKPARICVGVLCYDRDSLQVTLRGVAVELTAKELALLELLLSAPGKVFSRARILNNVWGYTADPLTNVVDVYMHRLRGKLQTDPTRTPIVTLRGVGFKLDPAAFDAATAAAAGGAE